MKQFCKSLFCLLLVVLLAAAALTGCAENETPSTEAPKTETQAKTEVTTTAAPETVGSVEELGEGAKTFQFDVTFASGETKSFRIHTDAETVGEALVALELIAGEDSSYGLYVKTVCEETLDYDADGSYWAFYVNGEFASTGVDSTPITEGETYAFVATKS